MYHYLDIEVQADRHEEEQKALQEIFEGEIFIVGKENIEKAIAEGKIRMADPDELPF